MIYLSIVHGLLFIVPKFITQSKTIYSESDNVPTRVILKATSKINNLPKEIKK
jgi:hypothetical protein